MRDAEKRFRLLRRRLRIEVGQVQFREVRRDVAVTSLVVVPMPEPVEVTVAKSPSVQSLQAA